MKIGAIVWGVKDLARSIQFWSQALDYQLAYPPAEDFAILEPKRGPGVRLSLNVVTSPSARRHHLDIYSISPEADLARLMDLGARRKAWDYQPGEDYIVLLDPDDNPFCLFPETQD